MNQKQTFAMGAMAGIIAVLSAALFLREGMPEAVAQSAIQDSGSGIVAATGGVLPAANDIFWVLNKRYPGELERKLLGKNFEGERVTLCVYRVVAGGGKSGQGQVYLIAARDITYDLKMEYLDNETRDSIREIRSKYNEELDKILKKER